MPTLCPKQVLLERKESEGASRREAKEDQDHCAVPKRIVSSE
jgi:hypothetical protein